MPDLKALQAQLNADYHDQGLRTAIVSSFPNHRGTQFQFGIDRIANRWDAAFVYDFTTTGGRIHYGDYSGELATDFIVWRNAFGIDLTRRLGQKKLQPIVGAQLTWIQSRLRIKDKLRIGESSIGQSYDFESSDVGLEPRLGLDLQISRFASCQLVAGYQFALSAPLHLDTQKDAFLVKSDGSQVHSNWSGLRLGLVVGVHLPIAMLK